MSEFPELNIRSAFIFSTPARPGEQPARQQLLGSHRVHIIDRRVEAEVKKELQPERQGRNFETS